MIVEASVGAGLALAIGILWGLRRRFLVTAITGRSMEPTYRDGDRVLVRRTSGTAVRATDVVVLRHDSAAAPDDVGAVGPPGRLIVKRVAAAFGDDVPEGVPVPDQTVPEGRLVMLGDNPGASWDSRRSGYYRTSDVVGVVVRVMG